MLLESNASVGPSSSHRGRFATLLATAKQGNADACGELLQWYTNYLTILATTQLDRKLRARVNPSDLVQETMLAAHRDFHAFRGDSQPELLAWLRKILINSLHRTVAHHIKAVKRDVRREVSIEQASSRLEESAFNLTHQLAVRGDSPSQQAQAREQAIVLSNHLATLSDAYREVIIYRILQGMSFEEVSERMGRSPAACRMLFLRGLAQLKTHLASHESLDQSE